MKLKDNLIHLALINQNTGIKLLDASISDAKGESRMILDFELKELKQAINELKSGTKGLGEYYLLIKKVA